jgi:hypothetical protein
MVDIAIKIEKLTDKDMEVRFYSFSDDQLKNITPLSELKTLETLIKALRIFESTKLYDITKNSIQVRLAKLLAYYNVIGDINAETATTNQ